MVWHKEPYVNFHDMNEDYIASKLEQLDKSVDSAKDSAESASASADSASASALDASNSADSAEQSASLLPPLIEQLEMTNARLDTLIVDGQTTEGNTELIDIRTGYDGASYATAGDAVRGQISNINNGIQYLPHTKLDGTFINYQTGAVSANASYSCAVINGNARMLKPKGCTKVIFKNAKFNAGAGWATYTSNSGSSTGAYIRGGQTSFIEFNDNDKYFGVSNYNPSNQIETFIIEYIYGEINKTIVDLQESVNDNSNAINDINNNLIVNATINLEIGHFIRSENGAQGNNANYSCTMVKQPIPDGCKKIIVNKAKYDFRGTGGWATYSDNTGAFVNGFNKGGQSGVIDIDANDKYFAIGTWVGADNDTTALDITYVFNELGSILLNSLYPLNDKMIAFVGDSVTYGYDDDNNGAQLSNPFPKQVSNILNCYVQNEGVSSASLMDGTTAGGGQTPKAWVNDYVSLSNKYDIVGTMIGINDAYRGYTLGTFNDTTADTFYGALHIFIKGMQNKYLAEDGKRIFMMIYPHYQGRANIYPQFMNAIKEVCAYYSVPVLDLSMVCGISPYNDADYKYWRLSGAIHSPHLTQLGDDAISPIIANWISSNLK